MKLGTRIFMSGLMASIVVTATMLLIGLCLEAWTPGKWLVEVKIFCVCFSVAMEGLFVFMLVLFMKWVWKED